MFTCCSVRSLLEGLVEVLPLILVVVDTFIIRRRYICRSGSSSGIHFIVRFLCPKENIVFHHDSQQRFTQSTTAYMGQGPFDGFMPTWLRTLLKLTLTS